MVTPEERQQAYYARWKAKNLEHWRAYQRRYYQEHRAAKITYATVRNQSHRDEANAAVRAWRVRHPDKAVEYEGRRRARKRGNGWEPVDVLAVFDRDGWRCHLCGRKVKPTEASIDHLIPIADGGPHSYANVATAHLSCNIRRGRRGAVQLRLA
jgi:5-methylcytosine-specific restriction endonuclease McrA